MDDTRCREFFSQPTHPYHRRYEALTETVRRFRG